METKKIYLRSDSKTWFWYRPFWNRTENPERNRSPPKTFRSTSTSSSLLGRNRNSLTWFDIKHSRCLSAIYIDKNFWRKHTRFCSTIASTLLLLTALGDTTGPYLSSIVQWETIEINEGKSVASFCLQVAAWFPDMFCIFCLVKNHEICY
jgi:hypothetical protein